MAKRKLIIHRNIKVQLPNGRTSKITYIDHPGAVIMAPLIDKDTVVMLKQFRPSLKRYIYELPAGTIDPGEGLLSTVKRELIEETGYRAKKITKLGSIYPVPGYSTEVIHLYKAEGLVKGDAEPEDYEVIQLIEMKRPQVLKLFREGKLMDAKSICVFAHLGWLV